MLKFFELRTTGVSGLNKAADEVNAFAAENGLRVVHMHFAENLLGVIFEGGLESRHSAAQPPPVPVEVPDDSCSIKRANRELEIALICRALKKTSGNSMAAARLLEISHRALMYKKKEYGINQDGSITPSRR